MKAINGDLLLEVLQAERASCCVADQSGLDLAIEILKEQEPVEAPYKPMVQITFDGEKMRELVDQAFTKFLEEHPELTGGDSDADQAL